jgi:hypothetical protein
MTTKAQRREQCNFIDRTLALFPSDKLQLKRSLAIKRLAEASAGLDAHLKTWTPDFYDNFINSDQVSILAGAVLARQELEYALLVALNEVAYVDDKVMGENSSRVSIEHIKAVRARRAARREAVRARRAACRLAKCKPVAERNRNSPVTDLDSHRRSLRMNTSREQTRQHASHRVRMTLVAARSRNAARRKF